MFYSSDDMSILLISVVSKKTNGGFTMNKLNVSDKVIVAWGEELTEFGLDKGKEYTIGNVFTVNDVNYIEVFNNDGELISVFEWRFEKSNIGGEI